MWETTVSLAFHSLKKKYFCPRETDEILVHKWELGKPWQPPLAERHLTKSGLVGPWSLVRNRLRADASSYPLPADVDPRAERSGEVTHQQPILT